MLIPLSFHHLHRTPVLFLYRVLIKDFTQLSVSATDNTEIASYTYEIVSGGGTLLGSDTATDKIYFAGNTAEEVQLKVTAADTAGNTTEKTLSIIIKEVGYQKISDTEGGFEGILDNGDNFGNSIFDIDDFDGDGVIDIAVGAWLDGNGGSLRGAVWILFLNPDGTVKSYQIISGSSFGARSRFGRYISNIKDFDGNGTMDIVAGAYESSDGGTGRGAVWILLLNPDGTVVN